jgi:exopolysaccharide biosynthesis WecB/TagA/CpsF family protein
MMNLGRHSILGVAIDAIDYDEAVESVASAAREHRWLGVAALPVHGIMTAVLHSDFAQTLRKTTINVPDGQPVRWALRLLHGIVLTDRVYGPELMLRVCERAARDQFPIFLFGSRSPVLDRLRQNLLQRFPALRIAGSAPGLEGELAQRPRPDDIAAIRKSGARIAFVALGCPKQEHWLAESREALDMPVIAVGAAFDFHAGTLRQAPPFLQRCGLEWAFRLAMEPQRLWRRYLLLNPAYLALIGLQWASLLREKLK